MYRWSVNNMAFNYAGLFVHDFFFSINTCDVSVCGWESIGAEGWLCINLYHFIYRTLASTDFFFFWAFMDFSICRVFWNQSLMDTQRPLGFWGVKSNIHVDFWLCGISVPQTLTLFKGQLYNMNTFFCKQKHLYI